jgi:7-carboxy-7-deazaguanine synthase
MSKFDPNKLLVSEHFYSVQGEGISSGVPSYFVRLTHCNLTCGASAKFVNQFKKDEVNYDPGSFKGDLHEEGKATWTCDTIPVWAKGENMEFQDLLQSWKYQGIYDLIRDKTIHIIWTGGEPTMFQHQESIVNFTRFWLKQYHGGDTGPVVSNSKFNVIKPDVYYEIETNGTFYINDDLFQMLDQINCSAKLSNSGMSEKQRIIPNAIKRIMEHKNYQFKFVISNEEDVKEIFRDYIVPFSIPLKNVVCMPGLDSQENFHERTRFVMEMAIKYKFIGLTRLHVSAWDKTTGV